MIQRTASATFDRPVLYMSKLAQTHSRIYNTRVTPRYAWALWWRNREGKTDSAAGFSVNKKAAEREIKRKLSEVKRHLAGEYIFSEIIGVSILTNG
jgi:hypothetical protein